MKKIVPHGDRILVKRRKAGNKIGDSGLVLPEEAAERPTDLADVVFVPDLSFADKHILDNAEKIIERQAHEAAEGNSEALLALLQLKNYLKIKSIEPGMCVMISKYVGTTFHDSSGAGEMTLVNGEDIIGIVREE